MARAKQTDRSAARRRHRQEMAAQAEPVAEGEATAPAPASDARRPARAADPARPGIMNSLRGAFRPVDLRGDLQAAPRVIAQWAVLIAVVAAVVSSAVFILSTNDLAASLDFSLAKPYDGKTLSSASNLSFLVVGFFVTPPPAAGAFLVGFFAKRASWLGGLVVGIVAAACYSVILLSPTGRMLTNGGSPDPYIVQAVILAPLGAVLFASAAAWYRRFLQIASPNRNQPRGRAAAKPKAKPAARR